MTVHARPPRPCLGTRLCQTQLPYYHTTIVTSLALSNVLCLILFSVDEQPTHARPRPPVIHVAYRHQNALYKAIARGHLWRLYSKIDWVITQHSLVPRRTVITECLGTRLYPTSTNPGMLGWGEQFGIWWSGPLWGFNQNILVHIVPTHCVQCSNGHTDHDYLSHEL